MNPAIGGEVIVRPEDICKVERGATQRAGSCYVTLAEGSDPILIGMSCDEVISQMESPQSSYPLALALLSTLTFLATVVFGIVVAVWG